MKYKKMGRGEKKIVRAFMYRQLDDMREENRTGGGE
jgi:hypothetical protein